MRAFIASRYPALLSSRFRRYWLGSFASVGGTQLIILGQGWLIFELTGSALQLGYLGVAASVPNIVITLVGGVIADRFDKRRIIIVTSALGAVLLSTLAALDYADVVAVWHVLAVAGLFSLVTGLDWPARSAIYPYLVERHALMSAVALNAFNWQATRMAIPALGGLLMAVSDTWVVFAIGALGFSAMSVVMWSLQVDVPGTRHESALRQLRDGFRFIAAHALFKWLLFGVFVGMFFSHSYVQIMPLFADLLGGDERVYGVLLTAGGIGSIIGTLLIGGLHQSERMGWVMLGGAVTSALATMAFAAAAQAGWLWSALSLAVVAAGLASVFMITAMTVLQMSVPDVLRGRVMGIHSINFSLAPLGGLFLGALADAATAFAAVAVGCTVYIVVILGIGLLQPMIRNLGREPIEELPVPAERR